MTVHTGKARRPNFPPLEAVSFGEKKMGLVYADIDLISGDDLALYRRGYLREEEIKRMRVSALVDSGAYMLMVNERVKEQLDLPVLGESVGRLADETEVRLEVAGPVEVRFENRRITVDALVLPGSAEVLLGAIPLEDLDVVIDPRQQRLIVNPESPYIARKHAK
jgi:clan AA aspartic protease